MKMKIVRSLTFYVIGAALASQAVGAGKHSYFPPSGFVPDSKTAVLIAEAVFMPIYGEDNIKRERPFRASLKNDVWTVIGTLPTGYKGGVAIAEISKKSGAIVRMSHGK